MVTIGYGCKEFPDTYVLLKRDTNEKAYVKNDIRFSDKFKARDFVDQMTSELELNGVTHNSRNNLTIETPAMYDFKEDDMIHDLKYNIKWRVVNVQTIDDGQMKENSMRPRKLSRIQLVR